MKKTINQKKYFDKWYSNPRNKMRTVFNGIQARCNNPRHKFYMNYGGRGIRCEWKDFETFFADMGICPQGYTIERLDNKANYSKENCKWATRIEQNNNRKSNIFIEFNNKKLTIAQWGRNLNIDSKLLWQRINRDKWSIERALTT